MAGVLGTALMLLECSNVGATIDIGAIPIPPDVPILRWLSAFPSYGFLLSVRPEHEANVIARFHARNLVCMAIGEVNDTKCVSLVKENEAKQVLWDFEKTSFILPNQTKIPFRKTA